MKTELCATDKHDPPCCSHLYREVLTPCLRLHARVGRFTLRLFAGVAIALAGVQWGMAVEMRRGRVLEHQQERRMAAACHPELGSGYQRPAIADSWYQAP